MGLSGCWAGHGFTIIEFHLWWWGMINTILDFEEESFSPLEWKKPPWDVEDIIKLPEIWFYINSL